MNRRMFLQQMGLAVLAMNVVSVAKATDFQLDPEDEALVPPQLSEDYLKVNSGEGWTPHRHDLLIPLAQLENPPETGIVLRTTAKFFHTHEVTLTKLEVEKIIAGETVIVKDSTVGEHYFQIYLPQ